MKRGIILFYCLIGGLVIPLTAQNESDERPMLSPSNVVSIKKDSIFFLNFRFRMQTRAAMQTLGGDRFAPEAFDAFIRRLRLRFDGFVLSPKFCYYIQLSFSRNDMELENGTAPVPIRDAMLYYFPHKNFYIGFGQGKLPGNRQRVISSGNIQMPERSLANNRLTLDRDVGFFSYWTIPVRKQEIKVKSAITLGEGRIGLSPNNGLAYTGRIEYLPLGSFVNQGDYSEGAVDFEKKPKLSIGAGINFNHKARKTIGTIGRPLGYETDLLTVFSDLMFKYRRTALLGEVLWRNRTDIPADAEFAPFTGIGYLLQPSVFVGKKLELAGRYSGYFTDTEASPWYSDIEHAALSCNYYFWGHRIKLQSSIIYETRDRNWAFSHNGNNWQIQFQVEFGI
jgi:phosphate-selective porin OprO and OprP